MIQLDHKGQILVALSPLDLTKNLRYRNRSLQNLATLSLSIRTSGPLKTSQVSEPSEQYVLFKVYVVFKIFTAMRLPIERRILMLAAMEESGERCQCTR